MSNCQHGIKEFEKLLAEYAAVEGAADEDFTTALKELRHTINHLVEATDYTSQGAKIYEEINVWLRRYGKRYGLHYDSPRCMRLAREMSTLISDMDRLEKQSLFYAKVAEEKLAKSRELEKKLSVIQEKYLDCLENGGKNCDCD
ncbi:MAG: hypothetical protein ACRCST_10840 [Turicibacter sp.]